VPKIVIVIFSLNIFTRKFSKFNAFQIILISVLKLNHVFWREISNYFDKFGMKKSQKLLFLPQKYQKFKFKIFEFFLKSNFCHKI